MSEHLCVVCPSLFPAAPVRYYERPNVDEACRARLRQLLAELVDVYAQLNLERLRGHGQRITGSREAPLPLRVDVLDLMAEVPALLDSWARDWQTYRWSYLPPANVSSLTGWLEVRLDWACDVHPAVDDFAGELREVVNRTRSAAGLTRSRPELIYVPCRECDQISLYRHPGDDRTYCADEDCRLILMPDEYDRWVKLLSYSVSKVA